MRPCSITQPQLIHVPRYLDESAAGALLSWARKLDWHEEQIRLFGRWVAVPRLVAWFGDGSVCYRYSGVDHTGAGWPLALEEIRTALARDFGFHSNFVLLNRYRCGRDSMGWHADDEAELMGPVVSLSLGATRWLLLRSTRHGPSVRFALGHGALLIHPRSYRHALPKTRRAVGERINLTFRRVRP